MIGLSVHQRTRSVTDADIERFRTLPVANVSDVMNRIPAAGPSLRPMHRAGALAGRALTVRTRPGDNLLIHKALDMAEPGDVILVEDQGDLANAISGENMMLWAARRGLAGVVVDGAMRDADSIGKMNFPVYARGINPRGPHKAGPGEINVPIACGGVAVQPGDIVVGDADGVLVIPRQDGEAVLAKARNKLAQELATRTAIMSGTWDRSAYTEERFRALGCEIIDAAYGD